MNPEQRPSLGAGRPLALALAAAGLLVAGATTGLWWGQRGAPAPHAETVRPAGAASATAQAATLSASAPSEGRKILYWYDPMLPATKFDKPGKSPFMDMDLVPKYADGGEDAATANTVKINPAIRQNLGMRLAVVTRGGALAPVQASGEVVFNDREVAVLQARSAGFVERVTPLAPGDVVMAGALLAELRVPEWTAAQQEYLALKAAGSSVDVAELVDAARARLRLTGMPESLIRAVDALGRPQDVVALRAPRAGVVQELGVRAGMSLMAGQTVAKINGIDTVWLDVAVPEAQTSRVRVGQVAQALLSAWPGETVEGRVTALLPALNEGARALRVRVELPNRGARLRPGLSAQVSLLASADADMTGTAELSVPTEAVIRTGTRSLVLVAEDGGRYRPVEVQTGGEVVPVVNAQASDEFGASRTRILKGLREGQKVVASGQFLIDSEASLSGLTPQALVLDAKASAPAVVLHEAEATVDEVSSTEITLTHGPFKSLAMPGMTMPFPLVDAHVAHGIRAGDKVRVGARQTDSGLVIVHIEKIGGSR